MRRLSALALLVLTLVACGSSAAPGWTYAPAPSPSAGGSATASGSAVPSAGASASAPAASPSAAASGSAAPSGGAGTVTITAPVGAATGGFDPTTADAAADTPFTLVFDNQDDQAPHNLVLQNADGSKVAVEGDTAFFTGPGTRQYNVPALAAGDYPFVCEVHPTTMKGTLTVK